ncbi:FliM/FliN family flagellar motor switch protein [candidate division KSB1 bacterium]
MAKKNSKKVEDFSKEALIKLLKPYHDMPLNFSVVLAQTTLSLKDVLELQKDSTIEFEKYAGEPVHILVNDIHVADGEVVVIDEKFGVRILNIIEPEDKNIYTEIKNIIETQK